MNTLIIDWSVLSYNCWFSMKSPNFKARTNIEIQEFARLVAYRLYYLKHVFEPEKVVFALDSYPIWREPVMDAYYEKQARYYISKYKDLKSSEDLEQNPETEEVREFEIYLVEFDRKVYSAKYLEFKNDWVFKKLTKPLIEKYCGGDAEVKELIPLDSENFNPDIHADIATMPADVKRILPKYKGNRKDSKWDYTTTKQEYKQISEKLVRNIASLMEADTRLIKVPLAEADDIIAVYCFGHALEKISLFTTDSDLSQLIAFCPNLDIFKPVDQETIDKIQMTQTKAMYNVAKKIMTGDTSDNIAGIGLKDKKTTMGEKSAEAYLEKHEKNTFKMLKQDVEDQEALTRNLKLIFLKNIPKDISQAIETAIEPKQELKNRFTWNDFGLDEQDMFYLRNKGKHDNAKLKAGQRL